MKNFYETFLMKGWRISFGALLLLSCGLLISPDLHAQRLVGVIPVSVPSPGFGIDGDAYANYADPLDPLYQPGFATAGDWFYDPDLCPGTATSIFDCDGKVLTDPAMTRHYEDGIKPNGDEMTIFISSNKLNDDPNTYTWGPGSVPPKDEMQRATIHFSWGDPDLGGDPEDLWCIFAADRWKTNGDSYIDFEFLQKSLFMDSNGKFTSEGKDGGRTVGDMLVTILFHRGGTDAEVAIDVWTHKGGELFEYERQPNSDYTGLIYITQNTVETIAPWDIYDQTERKYSINQFAEGAINLTKAFGISNVKCGFISTAWVRTKTSGENYEAELKDFPGEPFQVDIGFDELFAYCPDPVNLSSCTSLEDIQDAYANWVSGFYWDGGVEPVTENKGKIPPLPANVECIGADLSFTYTVKDYCEQVKECSSTFKVAPAPELVITCPDEPVDLPACTPLADIQAAYDAWVAEFTVTGGCNTEDNLDDIPALPDNVECLGAELSFTLSAKGDCEAVPKTCTSTFVVAPAPELVITCPDEPVDLPACTPLADIQEAYDAWVAEFTVTGGCNTEDNLDDIPALPDNVECIGAELSFTLSAKGDCEAEPKTCTSTFVVAPAPIVEVSCPIPVDLPECTPLADIEAAYAEWVAGFTKSGGCSATDNIADIPLLPDDIAIAGADFVFTYRAEDDCSWDECQSSFFVPPCAPDCQTFYAKGPEAVSTCFIPKYASNWGWTNAIMPGTHTWPLWAGAGQCDTSKGTHVGNVEVVYNGTTVTVAITMFAGFTLDEQHIYAGFAPYPGSGIGNWSNEGPFDGSKIYVIVHGVVCFSSDNLLRIGQISIIDTGNISDSELRVYPNPFDSRVNFEFVSNRDANARLEIFNITGQKLVTLMDRIVEEGAFNRVEYQPDTAPGVLFYRLTLGDSIINGKLIYNRNR